MAFNGGATSFYDWVGAAGNFWLAPLKKIEQLVRGIILFLGMILTLLLTGIVCLIWFLSSPYGGYHDNFSDLTGKAPNSSFDIQTSSLEDAVFTQNVLQVPYCSTTGDRIRTDYGRWNDWGSRHTHYFNDAYIRGALASYVLAYTIRTLKIGGNRVPIDKNYLTVLTSGKACPTSTIFTSQEGLTSVMISSTYITLPDIQITSYHNSEITGMCLTQECTQEDNYPYAGYKYQDILGSTPGATKNQLRARKALLDLESEDYWISQAKTNHVSVPIILVVRDQEQTTIKQFLER